MRNTTVSQQNEDDTVMMKMYEDHNICPQKPTHPVGALCNCLTSNVFGSKVMGYVMFNSPDSMLGMLSDSLSISLS